jgi:hypothetical protein
MTTLDVRVLDASSKLLESCHPARARLLVKEGKAEWYLNDPPTIQLNRAVKPSEIRSSVMSNRQIVNWTEYFATEHDIYVQNVANAQISLSFEIAPGNTQSFLVPHTRDPFNLTQHIPFAAIKSSADFRKMINRRPAALTVMSEDEYKDYYIKKAKATGQTDWMSAVDSAEEKRTGMQNKTAIKDVPKPTPIHKVVEDGQLFGEKKTVQSLDGNVSEDEIINPRVLHLCQQVNVQIEDAQKMKAHALLEELQTIEGDLKIDDFEYVRAHAYWKTVKAWAKTRIAALSSDDSEGAEEPSEASIGA